MDVVVDANVLLDILTSDPHWLHWSSTELRQAKFAGQLLVNPIICAEIAPAFAFDWSRIDLWLSQAGIIKGSLPFEASTVAGLPAHSGFSILGTILVAVTGIFGFGSIGTATLGFCTLVFDTGGAPWFIYSTWRDRSFWDA